MPTYQRYTSKISYGLWAPILLLLAIEMVISALHGYIIPIVIIAGAACLIILPMLLNTNYTIKDNLLKVRCGLIINKTIDIITIKRIKSTNSVSSAPALSMDRIEIFYNKFDSVIISPNNREDFYTALKQINPSIVIEN